LCVFVTSHWERTVYKRAGALTTYRRKIPGMLNKQNPRILSNNTKILNNCTCNRR
jgi:hypothetical protein